MVLFPLYSPGTLIASLSSICALPLSFSFDVADSDILTLRWCWRRRDCLQRWVSLRSLQNRWAALGCWCRHRRDCLQRWVSLRSVQNRWAALGCCCRLRRDCLQRCFSVRRAFVQIHSNGCVPGNKLVGAYSGWCRLRRDCFNLWLWLFCLQQIQRYQ